MPRRGTRHPLAADIADPRRQARFIAVVSPTRVGRLGRRRSGYKEQSLRSPDAAPMEEARFPRHGRTTGLAIAHPRTALIRMARGRLRRCDPLALRQKA